jgi:phosphoglucomutase
MYKKIYEEWLNSDKLSAAEKQELVSIKSDRKEMEYRFGKRIGFGTAGMRGLIKLGINTINVHMVKLATQGLSEYIKELGTKEMKRGVVISYDTRRKSYDFAVASAIVLASNGIKVRLFPEVHPVPMLSYAVRQYKAIAGIMITASHNPKEYNGYKIYGEDGAQMAPEATKEVVKFIDEIGSPLSDKILFDESKAKNIITIPKSLDKKYYKTILALSLSKKQVKKYGKKLKIVYTPIHGSGYVPVTTILKKIGIVPEVVPEVGFPFVGTVVVVTVAPLKDSVVETD